MSVVVSGTGTLQAQQLELKAAAVGAEPDVRATHYR